MPMHALQKVVLVHIYSNIDLNNFYLCLKFKKMSARICVKHERCRKRKRKFNTLIFGTVSDIKNVYIINK